jgi:hypothetical protein
MEGEPDPIMAVVRRRFDMSKLSLGELGLNMG